MIGARAAALTILAIALSAAPGAVARAHKKPAAARSVRAEDDPLLAGDARAFAAAKVFLRAPLDGAEVPPAGGVTVQLEVQGYALGPAARPPGAASAPDAGPSDEAAPAPFAILLVDNDGALRVDAADAPLRLTGLAPGPHLLRALLSRPWGEVIKAKDAFAVARFWVGPRPADASAARAAEEKVWPDPKKPILTYVFPLGELRPGLALEIDRSRAAAPGADESSDAGSDPPAPDAAALAADPPREPPAARPLPDQRELDFFLSGARLQSHGPSDKVRVVLDKRELPMLRAWRPFPLPFKGGRCRVTIDLLDRRSTKVNNAVNRTDRFVAPPEAAAKPAPAAVP